MAHRLECGTAHGLKIGAVWHLQRDVDAPARCTREVGNRIGEDRGVGNGDQPPVKRAHLRGAKVNSEDRTFEARYTNCLTDSKGLLQEQDNSGRKVLHYILQG